MNFLGYKSEPVRVIHKNISQIRRGNVILEPPIPVHP